MSFPNFVDPPTKETLTNARRSLEATRASVDKITSQIDAAEIALAKLVRESRFAINELEGQRMALEDKLSRTLAYLSPIRRLPMELLREIFVRSFEEHACSAWVLAAVCPSWRRLALRIPLIWSKIRLLTTQHSSADTIRLWLERSGDTVPLDIEIFLRVARTGSEVSSACPRRAASSPLLTPITPPWGSSLSQQHGTPHYMIPYAPPASVSNATIVMPPSPPSHQDGWSIGGHPFNGHDRSVNTISRSSMHWGHIAFFYLIEQMHRWERFIFRFDKQFISMGALKAINGDAPLLKEFEVSSAEAGFFAEWPWLPNSNTVSVTLPKLRCLRLQHTPFKWSSPMLRDLHTLNLRALPTSHLPLDRILFILSNNPNLKNLSLHFQGVLPAILPPSALTLPHVTTLNLGGHYLLTQLLDSLTLPNLSELTLDIEARDVIEDVISSLITRSKRPPVKLLSVAFGVAANAATFYYGPGGIVITWTALLAELPHLTTLNIGGTSLEPLLTALGPPEDDPNQSHNPTWACPTLEVLGMRSGLAHGEGMTRLLVEMVEARNPENGQGQAVGGVTPVRLEKLELLECVSFGEDVMRWLEGKIPNVTYKDPPHERSSLPNSYL